MVKLPHHLVLLSLMSAAPAQASYADDRAEIENLSASYMQALDAKDMETYVGTFTDDGVLDWAFGVEHGKAEIREAIGAWDNVLPVPPGATSRERNRHVVVNQVIKVNGDAATEVSYWVAFTNLTPQKNVQVVYFGHIDSDLKRVNGRWLYSRRKVYNESYTNRALYYPELGEVAPTMSDDKK